MKDIISISKTPLRVSFVGGGTDMPYFFEKYSGSTISCAIDRYIYVTAKFHNNHNQKYRLNYSTTENANSLNRIKNLRVKNVIRMLNIKKPLYINTFADVPANTGLGSSSSFTVGLIKALSKLKKKNYSKKEVAEMAFKIEKKITNNSVGKQDHYVSSYGGINFIKYQRNGVRVFPLRLSKKNEQMLFNKMMLVWTKKSRSAANILKDQKTNLKKNIFLLKKMNQYTLEFKKEILGKKINSKKLFDIINNTWKIKKNLSKLITNKKIDRLVSSLEKNKAKVGKLLGAGNGGFVLIHIEGRDKKKLLKVLNKKVCLDFNLEKNGSLIL